MKWFSVLFHLLLSYVLYAKKCHPIFIERDSSNFFQPRKLYTSLSYLFMKWFSVLFHHLLSYVLYAKKLHLFMREAVWYLMGMEGPSGFGSKSTAEQVTEGFSFSSHHPLTAIVTGVTSGIGEETARVMAKRGVRLIIPARDLKRAVRVRERILNESPKAEITVMEMDLTSFDSVVAFCSTFLSLGLPLNILINNAGMYSKRLELTEDNYEKTFATNYFGHFLMTELLLERMVETALTSGIEGRIINVSSVIHGWVNREGFQFDDMIKPKVYNGTRAYAVSKLAKIMHAKEIARQLRESNAKVTINAVHPGVVNTGIIRDYRGLITDSILFVASIFLKSTSQGASTTCYVALNPQITGITGRYFADCNESRCSSLASDEKEARKLWEETHAVVHKRLSQSSCTTYR